MEQVFFAKGDTIFVSFYIGQKGEICSFYKWLVSVKVKVAIGFSIMADYGKFLNDCSWLLMKMEGSSIYRTVGHWGVTLAMLCPANCFLDLKYHQKSQ